MLKLFLISLLFLVNSKDNNIEFGKEITFDKDNNKFEFTAEHNGTLFFYVYFNSDEVLKFDIHGGSTGISCTISEPGRGEMINLDIGNTYKINIDYLNPNSTEKGKIWINPSYNPIKVDLDKVYGGKFVIYNTYEIESQLTYIIENAQKDAHFKFKYQEKTNAIPGTLESPNPFEVCHGEECKENITSYDFKKGESYEIHVKVCKVINIPGNWPIVPPFSFYNNSNSLFLRLALLIISLFLLIL